MDGGEGVIRGREVTMIVEREEHGLVELVSGGDNGDIDRALIHRSAILVDLALDPEVAPGVGGVAGIIDGPVVGVYELSGEPEEGSALWRDALFVAAGGETSEADEAETEQAECRSVLASSFHILHLR
jgi:hypothetical protein